MDKIMTFLMGPMLAWFYGAGLKIAGFIARAILPALLKVLNVPPWVITLLSYLFGSLVAVWAVTGKVADYAINLVTFLLQKSDALPSGSTISQAMPGSLAQALKVANTFVPLDEMFSFLTAYMVLLLGCAIIRMVKSLIPSIA